MFAFALSVILFATTRELLVCIPLMREYKTKQKDYGHVLVTAYLDSPLVQPTTNDDTQMKNIMSIKDPLVVYTHPHMEATILQLRAHAIERTFVVTVPPDYPIIGVQRGERPGGYRDDGKNSVWFRFTTHNSWVVTDAIRRNIFRSDFIVWCDMSLLKEKTFLDQLVVQNTQIIPQAAMLMMISNVTRPKCTASASRQSCDGAQIDTSSMAGTTSTWLEFHSALEGTLIDHMHLGDGLEDGHRSILLSTCTRRPALCAFVTDDMVKHSTGTTGLLDILQNGGNIFHRDHSLLFWLPSTPPAPILPSASSRGVLCTLVRDEPDHVIWSWVVHHQQLGFDVVLYDDHSTHSPEWGIVHTFPGDCCDSDDDRCALCRQCASFKTSNSSTEHGYSVCQMGAYADCLNRYGGLYEWIGNWDVDEYIFPFISNNDTSLEFQASDEHSHPEEDNWLCSSELDQPATWHRLLPAFTKWMDVANRLHMHVALHGGTLLGFIRDCAFRAQAGDLDFYMPEEAFTSGSVEKLVVELLQEGFKGPTKVLGNLHERNVELSLDFNGTNVDLFIEYRHNETHSYFPYHVWPPDGTWRRIFFHSSPLTSARFMGTDVLVPSNAMHRVRELYGQDWRVPTRWENNGKAGSYMHIETVDCIATNCRGWDMREDTPAAPIVPTNIPQDLLMTWVNKVSAAYITPFLQSFREHNNDALVVIFVPSKISEAEMQILRRLQSIGLQFSIVRRGDEACCQQRFDVARKFLRESTKVWNRVIMSDAADVFFQRDPFDTCNFGHKECTIGVSEEDSRYMYRHDPARLERQCFGDDFVDSVLSEHPFVNSGFLWGTRAGFLELYNGLLPLWDNCTENDDQSKLNGLIRSGQFESFRPDCDVIIETDASKRCVQTLGIPYHIYKNVPREFSHSQREYLILGVRGDDASTVAAVHMWDDHPAHAKYVRLVSERMSLWSRLAAYSSLELQCYKYGTRRTSNDLQGGNPWAHQWRAPYFHLGDPLSCTKDVCETIGSEKRLSRTNAVISLAPHTHVLKKGFNYMPWETSLGVRCHHYLARTEEHVRLKAERNRNSFISKQLDSGTYGENGWFNQVLDPALTYFSSPPPDVCIAFLSCERLDKLQLTYDGVRRLIATERHILFKTAIVDNGSSHVVKDWIRMQPFDDSLLLEKNMGIAAAMDALWDLCRPARFILNVEDDWLVNEAAPHGVIHQSMRILDEHVDVLEVWLRSHAAEFQYAPHSNISENGEMIRETPILAQPLAYYLQASTKKKFPWWGSFTNGASLKHASRIRSIGSVSQDGCGDEGNCESEFAAKAAFLGWKVARLCWQADLCDRTSDNEPSSRVLFVHQTGVRSPGHHQLNITFTKSGLL